MIAIPNSTRHLERVMFRFALVVEESHSLRNSVVTVLKAHDWFVHGIMRAEQALHILAYIPYRLIVIDSELPGMCGIDFIRTLYHSRELQAIRVVVMTSSQSVSFAMEVAECGAFLVRKTTWKDDLRGFLSAYDKEPTTDAICDRRV